MYDMHTVLQKIIISAVCLYFRYNWSTASEHVVTDDPMQKGLMPILQDYSGSLHDCMNRNRFITCSFKIHEFWDF